MNPLFAGLGTTIFEEMSRLAVRFGAVNLGQGFPDDEGPLDVREAAAAALVRGPSQYPPMMGLPDLRRAVSEHYLGRYGQSFDAEDEILITAGATQALAAAILALVAPGDEVVLFAPMFDVYEPLVRQAGGIAKIVRLEPPTFALAPETLASAITAATRLVIFNSPQNPAARVYGGEELEALAAACRASPALVLCDEVWEHVLFDGRVHQPLATLPGMAERCLKIGSGGKIFSMTGWKVGWACGPKALVSLVARAHQFITFTVAPATQAGIAVGLRKPDGYFQDVRARLQRSRDRLAAGLRGVGYAPLPSEGTYFLNLDLRASGISLDDAAFCRQAVEIAKVAAIPVSAFYPQGEVDGIVRLCFAKRDDTLDRGVEALGRARRLLA